MKNLRFYETDAAFKAYEQGAGGDGNSTKTSVPGVSSAWDLDKTYFNPHDEAKLTHTVTVNYKDTKGTIIAESETIEIGYYDGVVQEIVITAKEIGGFVVDRNVKTLIIPDDSSVDFIYDEYICKPLTFNIISGGTIRWRAESIGDRIRIQYRINGGQWCDITSDTAYSAPNIPVSAGDVVQFRGDNATYTINAPFYNSFSGSTAKFEVEGNIMSLIDSTNFATATTLASSYTFTYLFSYCTGLTSAENLILPATTLTNYCYSSMFAGCTSLTTAPELPATTLASYCYQGMFGDCTSLTTAPALPATTLTSYCYQSMFYGCSSLTTAPELPATTLTEHCYNSVFRGCTSLTTAPALPATTLAWGCYASMFRDCTSLTTAPALPATALSYGCYSEMFNGCTSLTTAPELPATTLETNCYYSMFQGCTNLNYIKCLTTNISANRCTDNWVNGVSSTGTFVKNSNMSSWARGNNGIPTNWTIQNA